MNITIEGIDESISQQIETALNQLNKELNLELEHLSLQFISDEELLNINKEFLNHDYYTDIITFDLRDEFSKEAELYISTDRVSDNASQLNIKPETELFRVIIHGLLHLAGFKDKTETDILEMRSQENKYLTSLFHVKQF
jgi:probable rRNA maturation factor